MYHKLEQTPCDSQNFPTKNGEYHGFIETF